MDDDQQNFRSPLSTPVSLLEHPRLLLLTSIRSDRCRCSRIGTSHGDGERRYLRRIERSSPFPPPIQQPTDHAARIRPLFASLDEYIAPSWLSGLLRYCPVATSPVNNVVMSHPDYQGALDRDWDYPTPNEGSGRPGKLFERPLSLQRHVPLRYGCLMRSGEPCQVPGWASSSKPTREFASWDGIELISRIRCSSDM
jgi:hypothetical protein